ncbi:hypothetical protein LEP1GSC188_2444 [Leptospira weilii serovar Topaz str. LT2116]|uniref:Uncharacterized protein n=1 Tax=Leptospira weilii serovar Topaz str. LT2116 TaxID=1088540 RepID=M3GXG6_9LEPT|nr:hypothetical protein LEP1GSC188_2444 [Leptospira weilii serovar Topaz str. LT2116]
MTEARSHSPLMLRAWNESPWSKHRPSRADPGLPTMSWGIFLFLNLLPKVGVVFLLLSSLFPYLYVKSPAQFPATYHFCKESLKNHWTERLCFRENCSNILNDTQGRMECVNFSV